MGKEEETKTRNIRKSEHTPISKRSWWGEVGLPVGGNGAVKP